MKPLGNSTACALLDPECGYSFYAFVFLVSTVLLLIILVCDCFDLVIFYGRKKKNKVSPIKLTDPKNILTDTFKKATIATLGQSKSFHIHICWTQENIWKNQLYKELQEFFTHCVGKDEADYILALAEADQSRVEPCCNFIKDNLRKDGVPLKKTIIILCHVTGAEINRYQDKEVFAIWHLNYNGKQS